MSISTIHRVNFENHFTMTANSTHADENLSWAAKGLLGYLISLPADWKIHRSHLSKIYKGNRKGNSADAIDSIFEELIENGYIIYTKQDPKTGKYIHRYDVYPIPYERFKIFIPKGDNPAVDKPCMVEPPSLQNTNDIPKNNTTTVAPPEVVVDKSKPKLSREIEHNVNLIKKEIPTFDPSQAMSLAKKTLSVDLEAAIKYYKSRPNFKKIRYPISWLNECIQERWWENPEGLRSLWDTFVTALDDLRGRFPDKVRLSKGTDWIEVCMPGNSPMMIDVHKLENDNVVENICSNINKCLNSTLKICHVKLPGKNEISLL